jgi:hypothetical protein
LQGPQAPIARPAQGRIHGLRLSDLGSRLHSDWGIPRQSTGTRDLKTAEAILAALISTDKKKQVDGPRIEECIQKYL